MILLRGLGLLVSSGFCASGSLFLLRSLRLESRRADVLLFLLFFTAIQSLLILGAGLTGTLSFWPLTLASALGWGLLQPWKLRLSLRLKLPGCLLERAILILAALGALSLLLKTFLLSPSTGDALMYHLPKIAEWVQAERFVWGFTHDPRIWFSSGFELIETWWVVFLRDDTWIEMGGLQMALIAAAAVFTLAEALDVRPSLAALVYIFIPGVLLNATSCGNDLAVAALVLAGYALVATRAPRPIQAFPLLLAIGIKATGGFAALGVAAFAGFSERPPKLSRGASAALTGAGLLLAGFWYARNFLIAGHPLYPFHGSHGEFSWSPQQAAIDLESLQQTLQELPHRMLDAGPFTSMSRNATGWGWAVLPLGLPAMLFALREDRRYRVLALSFLIGACVTLVCVWPDDSNLRFLLWFPALFAVSLSRHQSWPWMAAALVSCVLNFSATLIPFETRHSRHIQVPVTVPRTEPVACVFTVAAPAYRLYNPDFSRRVFYPRSMEDLRRSGAKFVYLYETPEWAAPIREWPSIGGNFHEVP